MRRINPDRFQVATRGTSREINSRIVLSLVRERQPIPRADLARAMSVQPRRRDTHRQRPAARTDSS